MPNFKGWICADEEDATMLQSMGIVLGQYDDMLGTFEDCVASDRALACLSPHWGKFVWNLKLLEPGHNEDKDIV